RLVTSDDGGVSLVGVDEAGRQVVSVASLVLREAPTSALTAGSSGSLFEIEWTPLHAETGVPDEWLVLGEDRLGLGFDTVPDLAELAGEAPAVVVAQAPESGSEDVVARLRSGLGVVLGWLQDWLADDRFGASRLVVVTHGAVATSDSDVLDVASAPVWGLVRSAEQENPGRFVLVDIDDTTLSAELLAGILAT